MKVTSTQSLAVKCGAASTEQCPDYSRVFQWVVDAKIGDNVFTTNTCGVVCVPPSWPGEYQPLCPYSYCANPGEGCDKCNSEAWKGQVTIE